MCEYVNLCYVMYIQESGCYCMCIWILSDGYVIKIETLMFMLMVD